MDGRKFVSRARRHAKGEFYTDVDGSLMFMDFETGRLRFLDISNVVLGDMKW